MPGLWRRSARVEPVTEPVVEAPVVETPKYVTPEELNAALDRATQQMVSTVQGLAAPRPAPAPQQPPIQQFNEQQIADITEDELNEAFTEGNLVKYDKLQKQRIAKERQDYRRDIHQLKQEGMQAIAGLTQQMSAPKRAGLEKYQGEIDAILGTFPVETRANQQVLEFVYNSVRGNHFRELVDAEAEVAKRAANTKPTQGSGDAATDRTTAMAAKSVSWNESLDKRMAGRNATPADQALATTGKDPDQFARQLGYKNMEDYLAKTAEYETKKTHKW